MKTTTCIIQARRQSERLPNKIMLPLNGKPVLQHVIDRCIQIDGVTKVIVALPVGTYEDAAEELVKQTEASVFRGSMHDVLSRYWGAYNTAPADYVMRVTGDCPLLDPGACSQLVKKITTENADYGATIHWPHGLDCEVFRAELLERAHNSAVDAVDREHVTLWIKKQPNLKLAHVSPPTGRFGKGNRWVIDYPEDYAFLKALYAHMPPNTHMPSWTDFLDVINNNPALRDINANCEKVWAEKNIKIYQQSGQKWHAPT